jgi:hypothetical protein
MDKISHTKIKQPSFGEKRPKLTYTKISWFKVVREQSEKNASKERLKIPKRYSEAVVFENFLKD